MTDGFNFKLGRLRMNVERKGIFVEKHQAELEEMRAELQLMCPHREVEATIEYPPDEGRAVVPPPKLVTKCKLCGFTMIR